MEREISFTVPGNHKDPGGNPIGYKRVIGGKMRGESWDYMEYRDYVQKQYLMNYAKDELSYDESMRRLKSPRLAAGLRPIFLLPGEKARMEVMIYWADEGHGDPDNISKGMADALFTEDKHVAGYYDYIHAGKGKGRVEVKIKIMNEIIK